MNNRFNEVNLLDETLEGFQIIDTSWDRNKVCKRCGKDFIAKKRGQKFCSEECSYAYYHKMDEYKKQYGKVFADWLRESTNYKYAPEKF
jgi:hypothetical protein